MRRFAVILLLCASAVSCTRTELIRTGKDLPPLPENTEIAVFSDSKPDVKFWTIGTARIRGGSPEDRIEKAKIYARENGGNGIIVKKAGIITDPETGKVAENLPLSTYDTQEFTIIRFNSAGYVSRKSSLVESEDRIPDVKKEVSGPSYDYSKLPRATYSQLTKDYKTLTSKAFRGTLYPRKIYKIPSSVKPYIQSGDRLVSLTTRRGSKKILMIIKMNDVPEFKKVIDSKSMIDFVYSPVTVVRTKEGVHPVINYLETVTKIKK